MPYRFTEASARLRRKSRDGKLVFDFLATLAGDLDPGYPAPPCSNPDSPLYSDPGDPGYLEIHEVTGVEDVCIETPDGEEPDFKHLDKSERALVTAMQHAEDQADRLSSAARDVRKKRDAWAENCRRQGKNHLDHAMWRKCNKEMAQAADCAKEHRQRAAWLLELFASHQGVGPWTSIELTNEEGTALESKVWEQASSELSDYEDSCRADAAEARAEAMSERGW